MSLPVTVAFANPDPGFCPHTYTENVQKLNELVSASLAGSFTPYLVQDATPAVNQQSYIWLKTVSGKPTSFYKFHGGIWRKVWDAAIGDVKMFVGDPSGLFDSQGMGIMGGEQDGWHIMNGAGGTLNFNNLFPVSANVNPVMSGQGWSGTAWQTTIRGATASTGGEEQITLDVDNTYAVPRPEVAAYEWMADGNTGAASGPLFGEADGHNDGAKVTFQASAPGNETPDPIWIVPPYLAVCFLQFVGY